jgi:uncharacterized heparinase superfamily protein
MFLTKISLLLFTLRYLKPVQLYWRVYLIFKRFIGFNNSLSGCILVNRLSFIPPVVKNKTLVDNSFVFLNHDEKVDTALNWNPAQLDKLWLYNLHYFDYINQAEVSAETTLLFIRYWIQHNPIGTGNGWEPYPLSLRIVNWIKFLSQLNADVDVTDIQASLYLQCRFLFGHLEYHLLGNHLFKNGVALLYGGGYFQGSEAVNWLHKGKEIIESQTHEQVMLDGGHFERSPMYHLLILEDVLDCLNLQQAAANASVSLSADIAATAAKMLQFTVDTLHPDGEIGFFNDSALGIAPSPGAVLAYANRLGLSEAVSASPNSADILLIEKAEFGLFVLQNGQGRMLFDVGMIGPDYLPGHAHCDTLSYELSLFGQRCIVNSGTYQYAGQERNQFRATAAHNTVRIDNAEQHEIWSTFRVARRGYPFDIKVNRESQSVLVTAAHSGFMRLSGKPVHRRKVVCTGNNWQIEDVIEGQGQHLAESFIHLHPEVDIIALENSGVVCMLNGQSFEIRVNDDLAFRLVDTVYSAEFGLKQANKTLVLNKQGFCPLVIAYQIAVA